MKVVNVLIVDDHARWRLAIGRIVSDTGYSFIEASTFDQAIHEMQRRTFDVVISDIVLFGLLDGIRVLKMAKNHSPLTKLIAISGFCPFDGMGLLTDLGVIVIDKSEIDRITLVSLLQQSET